MGRFTKSSYLVFLVILGSIGMISVDAASTQVVVINNHSVDFGPNGVAIRLGDACPPYHYHSKNHDFVIALDTTLSNQRNLKIKIVIMPDGWDPDEFIREKGITEFRKLKKWSAFEWRLAQFSEDVEPESF